MTTIQVPLSAESPQELKEAEDALKEIAKAIGAKGIIKLNKIYKSDLVVRAVVNKKLGI